MLSRREYGWSRAECGASLPHWRASQKCAAQSFDTAPRRLRSLSIETRSRCNPHSGERISAQAVIVNADPAAVHGGQFGGLVRTAIADTGTERSLSAMTFAMSAVAEGFRCAATTCSFPRIIAVNLTISSDESGCRAMQRFTCARKPAPTRGHIRSRRNPSRYSVSSMLRQTEMFTPIRKPRSTHAESG